MLDARENAALACSRLPFQVPYVDRRTLTSRDFVSSQLLPCDAASPIDQAMELLQELIIKKNYNVGIMRSKSNICSE